MKLLYCSLCPSLGQQHSTSQADLITAWDERQQGRRERESERKVRVKRWINRDRLRKENDDKYDFDQR